MLSMDLPSIFMLLIFWWCIGYLMVLIYFTIVEPPTALAWPTAFAVIFTFGWPILLWFILCNLIKCGFVWLYKSINPRSIHRFIRALYMIDGY